MIKEKSLEIRQNFKAKMAEGVGFEPTCLSANGFQDFEKYPTIS